MSPKAYPWTVIDSERKIVVDSGPFFTLGEATKAANIWNRQYNHGHPLKTMKFTPANTYPAKDGATRPVEAPKLFDVGVELGLTLQEAEDELLGIIKDRLEDIKVVTSTGSPCFSFVTVELHYPRTEG